MLRRRAKCFLVRCNDAEASAQGKVPAAAAPSAAGGGGGAASSVAARPAGCVGVVNLFQSHDGAQTQVAVVLDALDDGDYLVAFTYAAENMRIYNNILKDRESKLPERRPYEEPRPKAEAPLTVNTVGKELCPDRRVLGGVNVKKGVGTLILTDDRFNLFDYIWSPVDGTFIVSRGTSKLGDAQFPEAGAEVAKGQAELDLDHFQSRRDEAALQDAMRPRSLQELLRGAPTNIPLAKAMPLLMAGENSQAFRTLGRFSMAMFLSPLLMFFLVRVLATDHPYRDVLSGGAAILTVNIVIGLYALLAYKESVADDQEVARQEELKTVRACVRACVRVWVGEVDGWVSNPPRERGKERGVWQPMDCHCVDKHARPTRNTPGHA
jgi:hypothetical protein